MTPPMSMESLETLTARRRTFAIIAHPDAGKTTLTEKLLLCGGAIQLALIITLIANLSIGIWPQPVINWLTHLLHLA